MNIGSGSNFYQRSGPDPKFFKGRIRILNFLKVGSGSSFSDRWDPQDCLGARKRTTGIHTIIRISRPENATFDKWKNNEKSIRPTYNEICMPYGKKTLMIVASQGHYVVVVNLFTVYRSKLI